MKKIVLTLLVASSFLLANGYKIPETSTNAVALGAANIAHNHENADAAYYNPAKMVFMKDSNNLEVDLTYIGLDAINYKGSVGATTGVNTNSEKENFYIPTLHYVSPKLGDNDARIGLSITAPGGLSKRWDTQPAKGSAQEFTLEVYEINPSAAFKISDKLGFAVGFRIVDTQGVVKAQPYGHLSQDMTGDSVDFGYNLALAYKPVSDLEIGVTYRSKVDLTTDGDADLFNDGALTAPAPAFAGNYSSNVSIPLPATLSVAVAYTLPIKTTLEFVYERTYWSSYSELNFDYANPLAEGVFGKPRAKNWKDTNTFRFGLTQELNDLTLMAGFVIDETPIPAKTVGFELPGTDTTAVSLGGRYKINDKVDIGLSAIYSMHDNRTITLADANDNGLNGQFTDGNVLIISAGLGYKF